MKDYKGPALPRPVLPLAAVALAVISTYTLTKVLPYSWSSLSPTDLVLLCLESFSVLSVLFISEFFIGAATRVTSNKASFSPAAAARSGGQCFAMTETNRIHQNHIESACIFAPAALAGADGRSIVASTLTWFVARVVYRIGYRDSENPFWRITGTSASMLQSYYCIGMFSWQKM